MGKYVLRFTALGYLALLLLLPVAMVFARAFEHGIGAAWASVTTPEAIHAFNAFPLQVTAAARDRQYAFLRAAVSPK